MEYESDFDKNLALFVKGEFEEAFEIFESANYSELDNTLMCSIHTSFDENAHNCIACNLEDSARLIKNYLSKYEQFDRIENSYPIYILILYLMVERIDEYLDIVDIHHSIKSRYFDGLGRIRRWANFYKHPKAFMLVHHPIFTIEGFEELSTNDKVIDESFINKYYSGKKNNKELYKELTNKDNIVVVLPSPAKLMREFCKAQKHFVRMISENEILRILLDEKATIYYENMDSGADS